MEKEKVSTIGREFTLPQLFRFVAPPVFTRLLVSLLSTLDDSLFVSRFLGPNALAAFSVAMPWFMFVDAIGMLMSSVSVVCSIKMGQKKNEEAKSDFTTSVLMSFFFGCCLTLFLVFFIRPVLRFLGETEILMPYATSFFRISRFYIPLILTNYTFNSFFVIAGKPKCSMISSAINIVCQFFFDWLFIVRLQIGIVGAAYANLIGNLAVTAFALFFFFDRRHEIHFVRPHKNVFELFSRIFRYGRMQAITSLAISLSSYISNTVQLNIGGEQVVAAYTIVNNVVFMFMNSFFGLIGSTSPIASYAFGEKNPKKLSRIIRQTIILMSLLMIFIISLIFFGKQIFLFLYLEEGSSETMREMVLRGFRIYPLALIFFGYNVYVQDLLNVLGNQKVSLFLSLMENVIFQNLFMIIIPFLFGIDAVWFVFPVAEVFSFAVTAFFAWKFRDVYGYGRSGEATIFTQGNI